MGLADNIALVQRYLNVVQECISGTENLDAIVEIFATDYINHHPDGSEDRGPAAMQEFVVAARDLVRRWSAVLTINEVIAAGDRVAARLTFEAPDPTGERVAAVEMQIYRIADGTIKERWWVIDDEAIRRFAVH